METVNQILSLLAEAVHLLGAWWSKTLGAWWSNDPGAWPGALLTAWPLRETLQTALLALAIERIIGWPGFLQKLTGHPVEWMGGMIGRLEKKWNDPRASFAMRRFRGMVMMAALILFWGVLAWLLHRALNMALGQYGWLAEALAASSLLAQSALRRHVRDVADALAEHPGDLNPARRAVGRIVGRFTDEMDESKVAHAAIESLAENTSDGIVAPAFWLALAGLPGMVIYKLVNTGDSMVGYRSERFLAFGWAAARLDDLMNLIPARLTGLLLAMAAAITSPAAGARALHVMWRDGRKHVSPNAGWPEAAMAGALDITLGGPRSYPGGVTADFPHLGDGRERLTRRDIHRALSLYGQMLTMMLLLGFFFWLFVA